MSKVKKFMFLVIRVYGCFLSAISLVYMPWKVRVKWAKILYNLTYFNPKKFPIYFEYIEYCNKKYNMGKRQDGMYKNIALAREKYENNK